MESIDWITGRGRLVRNYQRVVYEWLDGWVGGRGKGIWFEK